MVQIVYDDTPVVPNEIKAFVGINHFGNIVYRRKSLLEAVRELALKAGWPEPIHLCNAADVSALTEKLRKEDDRQRYLICPSNLVSSNRPDSVLVFLRQIEHSPAPLYMFLQDARGRRGWALMPALMLRLYLRKHEEGDIESFFEEQGERFVHVHDRLPLIDLGDEPVLQEFLSGQYDARHFNAVERDQYTVIKRSENREKLKEEFDFYHLVPPAMQTFLVQPFDFQDDGTSASYRMERIGAPDMATQWVNSAIQAHELERFLSHIFYFLEVRSRRPADKVECAAVHDALYGEKVKSRIFALKAHRSYPQLAPFLERACDGIDRLVERYLKLLASMRRRSHMDHLVIGHGDPCFSNIFYSKASQYLKLIDPRGAKSMETLFTDPYYDVAKLSHSVQGAYDFINNDKFEIVINERLRPDLRVEGRPATWASEMFCRQLEKYGFDSWTVRLYEASLFISMLPLHIDRPRKVLAFAINAANILDTLSNMERSA
jgi:hypothetical protein